LNRIIFIFCLLILIALAVLQAPSFLIVSDTPVKSDAVVLFLGDVNGTREKEARQLIREGFAEYLIISAYRRVKKQNPDGQLITIDLNLTLNHLKLKTASWLEDTHQEAVLARDMMDHLGLRSAILVSSPYHMRRIKLIAGRVFGERPKVGYVPTRYEPPNDGFWLFKSYDRKFVLSEYGKIIWFLLYEPFV
jgi:uncharacterized SAM-binding protein YcdF (DUF218 family)